MSYFVENNGSKVSLYFSSTKYFKMCWHIKNFFSSMKLFLVLSAIQNNIFWEWKKMNKGVILSEVSGRVYQPIKTQPFIAYAYPNSLVCPGCNYLDEVKDNTATVQYEAWNCLCSYQVYFGFRHYLSENSEMILCHFWTER